MLIFFKLHAVDKNYSINTMVADRLMGSAVKSVIFAPRPRPDSAEQPHRRPARHRTFKIPIWAAITEMEIGTRMTLPLLATRYESPTVK